MKYDADCTYQLEGSLKIEKNRRWLFISEFSKSEEEKGLFILESSKRITRVLFEIRRSS